MMKKLFYFMTIAHKMNIRSPRKRHSSYENKTKHSPKFKYGMNASNKINIETNETNLMQRETETEWTWEKYNSNGVEWLWICLYFFLLDKKAVTENEKRNNYTERNKEKKVFVSLNRLRFRFVEKIKLLYKYNIIIYKYYIWQRSYFNNNIIKVCYILPAQLMIFVCSFD